MGLARLGVDDEGLCIPAAFVSASKADKQLAMEATNALARVDQDGLRRILAGFRDGFVLVADRQPGGGYSGEDLLGVYDLLLRVGPAMPEDGTPVGSVTLLGSSAILDLKKLLNDKEMRAKAVRLHRELGMARRDQHARLGETRRTPEMAEAERAIRRAAELIDADDSIIDGVLPAVGDLIRTINRRGRLTEAVSRHGHVAEAGPGGYAAGRTGRGRETVEFIDETLPAVPEPAVTAPRSLDALITAARDRIGERQELNVQDLNEILRAAGGVNRQDLQENRKLHEDISSLAESGGLGFLYEGEQVGLQLLPTCKTGYFIARKGPNKEDILFRETEFPPLTAAPKPDRRRKANR